MDRARAGRQHVLQVGNHPSIGRCDDIGPRRWPVGTGRWARHRHGIGKPAGVDRNRAGIGNRRIRGAGARRTTMSAQRLSIHAGNATIGGEHDPAVRHRRRAVRLHHHELGSVTARVGEVLHVGGDIGGHRNAAEGDAIDRIVLVIDRRLVGVAQVVRHRCDDAARAEPEESCYDRVAVVGVRGGEPTEKHGAALVERAALLAPHHVKYWGPESGARRTEAITASCGEQGGGQQPRQACDRRSPGHHSRPPYGVWASAPPRLAARLKPPAYWQGLRQPVGASRHRGGGARSVEWRPQHWRLDATAAWHQQPRVGGGPNLRAGALRRSTHGLPNAVDQNAPMLKGELTTRRFRTGTVAWRVYPFPGRLGWSMHRSLNRATPLTAGTVTVPDSVPATRVPALCAIAIVTVPLYVLTVLPWS